jgi:hypothetical protein
MLATGEGNGDTQLNAKLLILQTQPRADGDQRGSVTGEQSADRQDGRPRRGSTP